MRLTVKSCDVSGITSKAARALDGALWVTAENVLSDCRDYIPYETGDLRNSGKAKAKDGKGTVEWGTDQKTAQYARIQYYGVGLNHGTVANAVSAPKACAKWFEAAKAVRKKDWERMLGYEYKRELQ